MKYVDENAWNALLEGIRNGRLLSSDAAARDAAITQLPILNAEIPAMLSSKALNELQLQMTTLLASLDDAKEVELYLANLSYFFHLASKAWEEAYDHVAATVAVESAAKFLSFLPAKLFILAIKTGISALTAGGAEALCSLIVKPLADGMSPELVGEVVDEKSKGAIKNIADVAPNFVFDAAAATTSSPVDAMVNPAKVFAQYEGHLRRVAVEIREKRRLPTYKAPQVHDHMVQSLKTLFPAGSELEVLVMAPTDDDDLRNKWDKVYSFLAATMRRAAWTQYCRANWDNASWDYTITVKSTDKFKAQLDAESDPRKWPAKIWDSVQGWPEYWDQICADFIGPEQLPDHPIHEGKPEAELEVIRNARNNQGWISMAAVHCCQIRRWNLSGHRLPVKFDLLHYERDDFSVKLDYAPLAKELVTTTTWDARYKAYLTKKPASCRIVNAFFSTKADKLFSPSGRKGRHDSPASPGQSLMVASGYANSLVVVGIRGSTQLTTNTVTLNIVRLPVTAAEASRVTAESDTGQMYKFYKVSNTTKTLITVLDANKKNVSPPVRTFSTGFKTGVNQTIKFKFEAVGLYCMWLTTTAEDFPVSDALWYVWVVPVPATATK